MTEPRYDLFCLLPLPLDLVFSYTGKLHTANVRWSTFFLPSSSAPLNLQHSLLSSLALAPLPHLSLLIIVDDPPLLLLFSY